MKLFLSLAGILSLLGCVTNAFYRQAADTLFPENGEGVVAVFLSQETDDVYNYAALRGDVELCVSELESERRRLTLLSHFTPTDAAIGLLECVEAKGWAQQ